ncbi:type II toxin-antitoxin system VapC family toxin [Enterobacter roggenkampii]|uniref:type II toxin-antitoxin system VapC family toxin n=1 Tax=Enterobacter roggenkampii TaxID=1812935 RepID=UPI001C5A772A|nr:PIN domain-containing protein [Enterobacter roggenkampii]MBW4237027.1 PIN domain-containing protein [Enterobacter roggenkampii]
MRVIFDTNILVQALTGTRDGVSLTDPCTGEIISDPQKRAEALIDHVDSLGGSVLIPTPVLAEFLVGIDKHQHQAYINLIKSQSCFEIVSFDEIAAIECAQMPSLKELKQMMSSDSANKVKFDRQIISIAKSTGVKEVWTHDKGVYNRCQTLGITAKSLADIAPLPEQFGMDFSKESASGLH